MAGMAYLGNGPAYFVPGLKPFSIFFAVGQVLDVPGGFPDFRDGWQEGLRVR